MPFCPWANTPEGDAISLSIASSPSRPRFKFCHVRPASVLRKIPFSDAKYRTLVEEGLRAISLILPWKLLGVSPNQLAPPSVDRFVQRYDSLANPIGSNL